MKRVFCLLCILFAYVNTYAQRFLQYNTETLFDSFENPAQRAIIKDSSNTYATNFFIPNFGGDLKFSGNAQTSLKSRLHVDRYDNSSLPIGPAKLNYSNANFGAYLFMFRMFLSENGDKEIGISYKTKGEGTAYITDETIALFNGQVSFPGDNYSNIFNSTGYYQAYNQLGISYRQNVNERLAFGIKVNALMGISYQKLTINESSIQFDKAAQTAVVTSSGTYRRSYTPGKINSQDLTPVFRHPGASISLGSSYKDPYLGLKWQANIKDLGFIHWSSQSKDVAFTSESTTLTNLKSSAREDSVRSQLGKYFSGVGSGQKNSFTTPTDAIAELGASKFIWLNYDNYFSLSPSVILQKNIFNNGFTAAVLGHLQYHSVVFTASTTINDRSLIGIGTQFMYKTPNFEIFLGSESLMQSAQVLSKQVYNVSKYSGSSFFFGCSFKFGPMVESLRNASVAPMGEKSFLPRLYNRLFKTIR